MSVNFELLIFLFLFFFRGYCLAHPFHVPVTLQVHFFYGSQKDVNIWISFWQECLNFHWQSATLKQSHSWECLVQTTACQTKCLNCEVALSSKGMAGFTKTYNIPTFLVFVSCNFSYSIMNPPIFSDPPSSSLSLSSSLYSLLHSSKNTVTF